MIFWQITNNSFIWTSIFAWFIAQAGKIFTNYYTERKFDIRKLVGSGGMPSSHSAMVVCLATKLGRVYGFDSPFFSIGIIFSFIVMYDAAGVRRAAGKQARAINFLLTQTKVTFEEQLKELIGHTPLQVTAGAVLGVFIGWFF